MSESNGEFNFDLITRKNKVVRYGGQVYTLKDASEKAVIEYEASRWRIEKEGDQFRRLPSQRILDSTSVLVSHCLFDKEGKIVPVETLRLEWPHQAIEDMFEWIIDNSPGMRRQETRESIERDIADLQQRLKKLDERPLEEMAKNSPAATVASSR